MWNLVKIENFYWFGLVWPSRLLTQYRHSNVSKSVTKVGIHRGARAATNFAVVSRKKIDVKSNVKYQITTNGYKLEINFKSQLNRLL